MKNCVAAIFLLLFMLPSGANAESPSFRAGLGYDFISQEFFLDSLTPIGQDSLDAQLAQTTNYLDDLKLFLIAAWAPLSNRRWQLRFQPEVTSDFIRTRLYSDNRLAFNEHYLQVNTEIDWRQRYEDAVRAGDNYLYGSLRARMNWALSDQLSHFWQVRGSVVHFDSTADFTYNHGRLQADIGLSRTFDNFSSLTGLAFIGGRLVPDSTQLDYLSFGAEVSLFAFYKGGDLDLLSRLERKDYNALVGEDDYTRFELLATNTFGVSGQLALRQEVDAEFVGFSDSDLVNANYFRGELTFQAGLRKESVSYWGGLELEHLTEQETEYTLGGEDYVEYGVRFDVDILTLGGIFAALESSTGRRHYLESTDFATDSLLGDLELAFSLTDFTYERLTLLGDVRLTERLGINMLLSAEWEWHEVASDDNRLVLFTSAVQYRF